MRHQRPVEPKPNVSRVGLVERVDDLPLDVLDPLDHELRDPITAVDLVGGLGIGVHEQHLDLAAVLRVDEARCVEHRDAVLQREARTWEHEAAVAGRDRDGEAGGHERPAATRRRCTASSLAQRS